MYVLYRVSGWITRLAISAHITCQDIVVCVCTTATIHRSINPSHFSCSPVWPTQSHVQTKRNMGECQIYSSSIREFGLHWSFRIEAGSWEVFLRTNISTYACHGKLSGSSLPPMGLGFAPVLRTIAQKTKSIIAKSTRYHVKLNSERRPNHWESCLSGSFWHSSHHHQPRKQGQESDTRSPQMSTMQCTVLSVKRSSAVNDECSPHSHSGKLSLAV